MFTRDSTELTDPQVVPSLADKWSHHTGGTHIKVVPCHWRATAELPGLVGTGSSPRAWASARQPDSVASSIAQPRAWADSSACARAQLLASGAGTVLHRKPGPRGRSRPRIWRPGSAVLGDTGSIRVDRSHRLEAVSGHFQMAASAQMGLSADRRELACDRALRASRLCRSGRQRRRSG